MDDMENPRINIYELLSLLEEQEKECQSIINSAQLKDRILSLKLGLRFLETFLSFSRNENLKMRIEGVVYIMRGELHSLSNRRMDESLILYFDHACANLREKMKNVIIKPETREYDDIFFVLLGRSLAKTNNFLLESIRDLSCCKAELIAPSMNEIEDIKEKLIHLQALFTYLAGEGVYFFSDENQRLLAPLVVFLEKASCLLYSCSVDKMDREMALAMKREPFDLLEKIKLKEIYIAILRASKFIESTDNPPDNKFYLLDNLIELLDCNARVVICLNDPSMKLRDELKFIKMFLVDLPRELKFEILNYLITSIEAITCTAIPILYSCYDKDMKEGMAMEVNGALSEVIDQIDDIKLKALIQEENTEIKLYNYPKTDALGFLDTFLEHLEELLKCQSELIKIPKNQIEILHVEFDFLRSFLGIIKGQHNVHEELEEIWAPILHLAYQAEYVIDSYLVSNSPHRRITLSLSRIIKQIEFFKSEATRITDGMKYHTQAHDVPKTSSHVRHAIDTATDEVVGFEDEADKVMEYLVGDPKQLDVVSIVGMPGLGKTTLAKKMYETPSIIEHFDIRAWCSVSQTYRKGEMLLTILRDVIRVTDEINKLNDEELAAKLYQSLKGRRYLIVIDDLWDINAWDDLQRSLPNDNNHSRILVTSRLQNVASQIKAGGKVHPLREFSDNESWELFQKKLFQEESFSQEFWYVGQQIAQNCKRLPLSIVVIAGLLAKVNKDIVKWKQIALSLSSHILSDSQSQCKTILELSYNQLPDHLRSCFLYIGSFPEDKEIPVWKLKLLWIAEGFVRKTEGKSLEDVVEEYFVDLVSRSLVTATKERSLGGVKACRVHDLLHDFCLEKAKEERFLHVIHANQWSNISSVYYQRRLSIYSKGKDFLLIEPFGFNVRSLLHTGAESLFTQDISFIFKNFKLLRVLDVACIKIAEFFSGIELLIHLRYLAVEVETISITPSIANLWNLQSFLVKANNLHYGEVLNVPDSLWDMGNLRHVHINHQASFIVHRNRLVNSSLLANLETLSTPWFSCTGDAEDLLRRLPTLRKLRCVYLDCWDYSRNCYRFPALDFLSELLSLKVIYEGLHWGKKWEFNFPLNLQKLTLSKFRLLGDDISKIGRTLPNLKVFKLIGGDCGEQCNMNDGDFPKLKYLKLSSLRFHVWVASEDSFPVLEQLVLDNCWCLNEIPPCFGEIPTLRMITVKSCKSSLKDSVRRIQMEQQEELQNVDFKVHIH